MSSSSSTFSSADGTSSATRNRTLRYFLFGQCANLFKFSVWWVTLSPLVLALTRQQEAVGVSRIVYNVAICVLSPLGAILVERVSPRRLLLSAASVRFLIWVVVCPILGLMSFISSRGGGGGVGPEPPHNNDDGGGNATNVTASMLTAAAALLISSTASPPETDQPSPSPSSSPSSSLDTVQLLCYVALCVMLAVDGLAVAASSLLDIDVCGVDILAGWIGAGGEVEEGGDNNHECEEEGRGTSREGCPHSPVGSTAIPPTSAALTVTDDDRNYFNARAEGFFSLCFIVLAPAIAWLGLLYQGLITDYTTRHDAVVAGGGGGSGSAAGPTRMAEHSNSVAVGVGGVIHHSFSRFGLAAAAAGSPQTSLSSSSSLASTSATPTNNAPASGIESLVLSLIFANTFLIATLLQFFFFRLIPLQRPSSSHQSAAAESAAVGHDGGGSGQQKEGSSAPPLSSRTRASIEAEEKGEELNDRLLMDMGSSAAVSTTAAVSAATAASSSRQRRAATATAAAEEEDSEELDGATSPTPLMATVASGVGAAVAAAAPASLGPPIVPPPPSPSSTSSSSSSAALSSSSSSQSTASWGAIIKNTASELWEAIIILKCHPPLFFRILFLGLEIAVEDCVIAVVIATVTLRVDWLGAKDSVEGNIWAAMLVACGKLGALVASTIMAKFYVPPDDAGGFRKMFIFVGVASLFTVGFPLAVHLREASGGGSGADASLFGGNSRGDANGSSSSSSPLISENGARAILFISSFFFFLFSTLPKIGFQMLLQSMVSTIPNGHRVFGFIAIVAMACDAAVIMALSAVLDSVESLRGGLYICAFVFVGHGVLEVVLGPWLVLRGATINHNHHHHHDHDGDDGRLIDQSRSAATDVSGSYVPYEDLGDGFGGGGGAQMMSEMRSNAAAAAAAQMRSIDSHHAHDRDGAGPSNNARRGVSRRGRLSGGVVMSPQSLLEDD